MRLVEADDVPVAAVAEVDAVAVAPARAVGDVALPRRPSRPGRRRTGSRSWSWPIAIRSPRCRASAGSRHSPRRPRARRSRRRSARSRRPRCSSAASKLKQVCRPLLQQVIGTPSDLSVVALAEEHDRLVVGAAVRFARTRSSPGRCRAGNGCACRGAPPRPPPAPTSARRGSRRCRCRSGSRRRSADGFQAGRCSSG